MVFVKSKEERKAKYLGSLGQVPVNYKSGIERTQGWKESAIAGQALYEQKMADQSVLKRRERSLQKVSEGDWKNNAINKGATRIASGMQAGAQKQADNYEPIAEELRGLSLAPRSADPMANIDARVKPVVAAAIRASPKNR